MRWGDMDALGHMNNTVYFRFLEQARISWFDNLEIDYRAHNEAPILGSVTCRFVKPAVYPADLAVTLYAAKPSARSFSLFSEIRLDAEPRTLFAQAHAVMVWIDLAQGTSRPLPDWLRQTCGG